MKSKDFFGVAQNGKILTGSGFKVRFLLNNHNHARLGITVSRHVSKKACVRNHIKRHLREYFRKRKSVLPPFDIVFIANSSSAAFSSKDIKKTASKLFKEISMNSNVKNFNLNG